MSAGRDVWVKIRASEAERAEWHAKARSAGLTLSDLVRRSVGRVRTWPVAHAEVLRGDPHQVAAVADALAFEHKYTSGVIAWAPDDTPTDAQIDAVLDAFEETAWAGLEPDRYAWAAVLHRERGGGAHVHVLAARCDLGDRPEPEHRASGLGEDVRHGAEPGRCRRRLAGGGPRGAAPRQELPDGPGSRDWAPVAAKRRAVCT